MDQIKKLNSRLLSCLLVILILGTCIVPVQAADLIPAQARSDAPEFIPFTNGSEKISGVLEEGRDAISYEIAVDHSVYPEFAVYAYTSGAGLGVSTVYVYDEDNKKCGSVYLLPYSSSGGTALTPKGFIEISDTSGEIKTYTVRILSQTDNAGYTISAGPISAIDKHLGGAENAATVGRTGQATAVNQYISSYLALMNGEGDWYRYTPETNDATYIGNLVYQVSSTAFEVYDAETSVKIYDSSPDDQYFYTNNNSTSTVMQNRLTLEMGKEYLIRSFTPTSVSKSLSNRYRVFMGTPSVRTERITYSDPTYYTIPANRKTTIRVNVTSQSDLARLTIASIVFGAGSAASNASITSCKITAPTGQVLTATNGTASVSIPPDLTDFLNNSTNIPINGRWTIEVQTDKKLNLHLYMSGTAIILNRNSVPEE